VVERGDVHPVTVQRQHLGDELVDRDVVGVEPVEVLDVLDALVNALRAVQ
jgi:hypothetical protein